MGLILGFLFCTSTEALKELQFREETAVKVKGRMELFYFSENSLGFSPTLGSRSYFLIILYRFSVISIISICGYCQGPMLLCF